MRNLLPLRGHAVLKHVCLIAAHLVSALGHMMVKLTVRSTRTLLPMLPFRIVYLIFRLGSL